MSGELGANAAVAFTAMEICLMSFMGKAMGQNKVAIAKLYLTVVLIIETILALVIVAFFLTFRDVLANAMLSNPTEVKESIMIFGIFTIFLPFDLLQINWALFFNLFYIIYCSIIWIGKNK